MLGLGLSIWSLPIDAEDTGPGTELPPILAIAGDGWQATYPDPPTFDPVGSPETITVTRQGFDASGGAVSVVDFLTLMQRVRQPGQPDL